MTFLQPIRLWLLLVVPVLLVGYLLLLLRKRRYAVRFTNLSLLDAVAPRRLNWRQHVAVGLALLTLGFAIVLFAKPSGVVKVPRRSSVTVVLTMDISLSMAAQDVPPDRITAAKRTAEEFLGKLPADYEVSLVTFARHGEVVVPPTVDKARVSRAVNGLSLREYTATGEGIFTALDVVKQSLDGADPHQGSKLPAMIVLISDGKRTVGRSQVLAARAAKREGVPIYTVALGTRYGTIVTQGEQVTVPVEIQQLKQIAAISGGKAYVASSPAALLSAYRDVNGRLTYKTERTDATSHYVGYLVVLALVSTAAGLVVATRWP